MKDYSSLGEGLVSSQPRLLTMTGAVLLTLYLEKEGLLTPDIVERINETKSGLLLNANLNQVHVTVGDLERSKRIVKERTTEKTNDRHNPPTRIRLTELGRKDASALLDFFRKTTSK
jgi:hypothetical protein